MVNSSDVAIVLGLGLGVDIVRLLKGMFIVKVRLCWTVDMSDYCDGGLLPHHIRIFLLDY